MTEQAFCQPCSQQLQIGIEECQSAQFDEGPASLSFHEGEVQHSDLLGTILEVMPHLQQTYSWQKGVSDSVFKDEIYREGRRRLVEKLGLTEQQCQNLIQYEINLLIRKKQEARKAGNGRSGKNLVNVQTLKNRGRKPKIAKLSWM